MKKVCFFGIYDPTYARNRILAQGFKQNGFEVDHCRVDSHSRGRIKKFWQLYRLGLARRQNEYAYVIVAFPGQMVVWLARLLFGRGIIFDAHLSLYDSNVFDRRKFGKVSAGGFWNWFLDWHSCYLSWKVLLDTDEHISYFVQTFGFPRSKFVRVLVGADASVFHPQEVQEPKTGAFTVHFHGSFIPLQGVPYIIEAAKIIKDRGLPIQFQFVGSGGAVFVAAKQQVVELGLQETVNFVGRVSFEDMPRYISQSHICLGIFGDTAKAGRVVPNKVYECLAMGAPVLTARTPAALEVLRDGENSVLCRGADAGDLATKIEKLWQDEPLRRTIGRNGVALFRQSLTPQSIVRVMLSELGQGR